MKDKISVIIPVYNVAQYLPQCLDSVLNQDHEDLEVILINDGSKDDSGAICDRYAAQDARIKVIHQKNAGAAAAKNAGLRIATGKYLSFVDSDDYLEPNVYGYMLNVLKEHDADAAQFAFREVYKNRAEDQVLYTGREVTDSKTYLVRFTKDWSCPLLWNKLYKRELYDGVFFEEGHKIDDEYFTYQGFLRECKIVRDDRIVYNYRKRASSVMGSAETAAQRVLDTLDSMIKRREHVLKVFPELRREFDENYLDVVWYMSENEGNTAESLKQIKWYLRQYFREQGHSRPPKFLWLRLLRLYISDIDTLLKTCRKNCLELNTDDYFA